MNDELFDAFVRCLWHNDMSDTNKVHIERAIRALANTLDGVKVLGGQTWADAKVKTLEEYANRGAP